MVSRLFISVHDLKFVINYPDSDHSHRALGFRTTPLMATKFHLMYLQASSSRAKLHSLQAELKLVEANTNTITEVLCNTFSAALPKRKCGKFRPKFN